MVERRSQPLISNLRSRSSSEVRQLGIVRFALGFQYTFHVVAALILLVGVSAIAVTPTDILPQLNINPDKEMVGGWKSLLFL
jgi:hypothetical protein